MEDEPQAAYEGEVGSRAGVAPGWLGDVCAGLVRGAGYDVNGICVGVTVPDSVIVREAAAWSWLHKSLASSPTPLPGNPVEAPWNVIALKDAVKQRLLGALSDATDLALSPNAPILLRVDALHMESAHEASVVLDVARVAKSRKRLRRDAQVAVAQLADDGGAAAAGGAGAGAGSRLGGAGDDVPVGGGTEGMSAELGVAFRKLFGILPRVVASPPVSPATRGTFHLSLRRQSVYVSGWYRKVSRGVAQSEWLADSAVRPEHSVAGEIAAVIVPLFRGSGLTLHSAGREDVDVRMLGRGRPFVVELAAAKRSRVSAADLSAAEAQINAGELVTVQGLALAERDALVDLRDGSEDKRKEYCGLIWTAKPFSEEVLRARLDALEDVQLAQATPIRVLHRRSLMTRAKVIHRMRTERINDHFFLLWLVTSAGAYVKEFVHSDLGRTEPSVAEILGCRADILQLDVINVLYDTEAPLSLPRDRAEVADRPEGEGWVWDEGAESWVRASGCT